MSKAEDLSSNLEVSALCEACADIFKGSGPLDMTRFQYMHQSILEILQSFQKGCRLCYLNAMQLRGTGILNVDLDFRHRINYRIFTDTGALGIQFTFEFPYAEKAAQNVTTYFRLSLASGKSLAAGTSIIPTQSTKIIRLTWVRICHFTKRL